MGPSESPEAVYHYTDQKGLIGILKTKEFWCTHVAYLNDATERHFARQLVDEMLTTLASDKKEDQRMRQYAEAATQHWLSNPPITPVFVGSFSEADDDLSQWRAYSNTGSRFAIGFRTEALLMLAKSYSMNFEKLIYNREAALKEVRDAFVQEMKRAEPYLHMDGIESGRHPALCGDSGTYHQVCTRVVETIGPHIKHNKFAGEREWRLTSSFVDGLGGLKFRSRPGKSLIVPYVALELHKAKTPFRELSLAHVRTWSYPLRRSNGCCTDTSGTLAK